MYNEIHSQNEGNLDNSSNNHLMIADNDKGINI